MFSLPDHPIALTHTRLQPANAVSLLPTPESSWPVTPTAEHSLFYPHDTPSVPLTLMIEQFPEIPYILAHPHFITLVRLWGRFQLNISLSKTPEYRNCIHDDLGHIAIQCDEVIRQLNTRNFFSTAYPDPPHEEEENPEANSSMVVIAFGRLKERVEMLQLVLQVIENGRVWFNQEPKQALLPILESHMLALQQQQQVDPSYLTCAYIHPSAVVVKDEQPKHEHYVQDPWCLPVATPTAAAAVNTAASAPETPPVRQEQSTMGSANDSHEIENEAASMQETDDSQSPMESPFDDDTEFELMDEDETNDDDDDDGYTEIKRHDRTGRRRDLQQQRKLHKNRTSEQDVKGTGDNPGEEEDDDDMLIARTEGGCLKSRRLMRAPRQHTRRTATSYDAETTHYLKSVFFSIYSKRDKLTKEQRRQVQLQTGLKPRNITYWFSNHKRRFQRALKVYKQTVKKTGGAVKSYDDFLLWRRHRGLTDEVLDEEEGDEEEEDEEEEANADMVSPIRTTPAPYIATDGNTASSSSAAASPWTLS